MHSLDDPRLEPYRALKRSNATRWTRRFVAEGGKLVWRLLASGIEVESLLLAERVANEFAASLAVAISPHVAIYVVPDGSVESIVGFNFHRGALACGLRPEAGPKFDSLLNRPAAIVVCPEVHDPENLGSIVRTAAALGADGLVVGATSCDPYSRRVLRVSMGAVFALPVIQSTDLMSDLARLREAGFQLVATVLDPSAERLDEVAPSERLAIILGSEGHGLPAEIIDACSARVTIPMQSGTDSLNVSVAAGIFLHHFLAHRSRHPAASATL